MAAPNMLLLKHFTCTCVTNDGRQTKKTEEPENPANLLLYQMLYWEFLIHKILTVPVPWFFFYGLLLRKHNSFPVFFDLILCLVPARGSHVFDLWHLHIYLMFISLIEYMTKQNICGTYVKFAMYQNEGLFQINHTKCTTFWSRCLNCFQMQKLDAVDFLNNGNVSMKSELNETKLCNINQVQTYLNWRERKKKPIQNYF